jgi:leucyl-tRNA synthetase
LWKFAHDNQASITDGKERGMDAVPQEARHDLHQHLHQANFDYERKQFNTVASASHKILNLLDGDAVTAMPVAARAALLHEGMGILLRLLAPITPHAAQALWRELGYGADILEAPWPEVDEAALVQDEIDLVLQVNGKLRGSIRVARTADSAAIERLAMESPNAQKHIAGQTVKKVVVVPGRLVNIVV